MIIKTKKVYYCSFCGKHGLRPVNIHEKHCTLNSDRECRLCEVNSIKPLIEKYSQIEFHEEPDRLMGNIIKWSKEPPDILRELLEDVEQCPICCLTIIRIVFGKRGVGWCFDFDYKKAIENWWKEKNEEQNRRDMNEIYYQQ